MIYRLPAKRIASAILRLAIVAAVAGMVYASWSKFTTADSLNTNGERIWSALRCAADKPIEDLRATAGDGGIIDISRFGCGSRSPFYASEAEIAAARRNEKEAIYGALPVFELQTTLMGGLFFFIATLLVGGLILALGLLIQWVLIGG